MTVDRSARVLFFGCAAADAAAPPPSPLASLVAAVRARGHVVAWVWHSLRWASALPLGEHAVGAAVVHRTAAPDEVDPCALGDQIVAGACDALAAAVAAFDPDAVVLQAEDAPVVRVDLPHPRILVVATAPAVDSFEAWLVEGRGVVAAWRTSARERIATGLRLTAPGAS